MRMGDAIQQSVTSVTKDWTTVQKKKQRDAARGARALDRYWRGRVDARRLDGAADGGQAHGGLPGATAGGACRPALACLDICPNAATPRYRAARPFCADRPAGYGRACPGDEGSGRARIVGSRVLKRLCVIPRPCSTGQLLRSSSSATSLKGTVAELEPASNVTNEPRRSCRPCSRWSSSTSRC
jgi:hypothetical protein